MSKILIINGPNLNLTGTRQPEIYGHVTLADGMMRVAQSLPQGCVIDTRQSNHEGIIIDWLQEAPSEHFDGIVLNAGAYTHTSLAIADAIAAITVPVVEVHLTNTAAREPIRQRSLIAPVCRGTIAGFGFDSYRLAILSLLNDN